MNEEWIFVPCKDSFEGDMFCTGECSLEMAPPECVAVNTLGFYKSKIILPLMDSAYFSEKDGIYLRKSAFPPGYCENEEILTLEEFLIENHS